jgi:hypothetical protein
MFQRCLHQLLRQPFFADVARDGDSVAVFAADLLDQ